MELHSIYGPSLLDKGWVPAPRYLLRRQLILNCLRQHRTGDVLEVGCGPGVLLYELAVDGWNCSALEQSLAALEIARDLHSQPGHAEIYEQEQKGWAEKFDWLLAMEVLEHIEDDYGALLEWRNWLKPDGRILLSVPAHEKKWNNTDIWAGHYRRYERENLIRIFEESGYHVEKVMSYGFPVSNIIEPIRAFHHGRLLKQTISPEQRVSKKKNTDQSGVSRTLEKRLYPFYSNAIASLFMKTAFRIQNKFLDTDLGTGYIVQAKRVEK